MKVGLKFCGGCNPTFDRSRVANLLREKLRIKGINLIYVKDDEVYDYVFIINGCLRSCSNIDSIKIKFKDYWINQEKDLKDKFYDFCCDLETK